MTATLIYNPSAGKDPLGVKIRSVREALDRTGISHHFQPTRSARDGTRLAQEAVQQGSQLVIAAGGDGTINEVVNGLVGTDVPLALVPLGTGNLAAYEFGIPRDPVQAAKAISESRKERIDVGKANGRFFLMMVSLGMDAQALRDAPAPLRRVLKWWAVYLTGVFCLFVRKPVAVRVSFDDKTLNPKVRLLVVSNIKGYGLPGCEMIADASVTDGYLDLGFFKSQSVLSYLHHMRQLGRQKPVDASLLHHHTLMRVLLESDKPIPVQMDGDFFGYTPVDVSVVPQALSILTLRPER